MEKPVNPFDYYTKINLNLWTDDQNFIALVEHIQEQSPKVGNPVIRKKHLMVVLANLYYTWLDDPEKYVGYYRFFHKYKARSQYNILKISTLLIKIVDDLIELNYLDHKKGFYDRSNQSRTARMRTSDALIKLFKYYKLQPNSVELLSSTPSIILRDIKDDGKEEIDFEYTEELETLKTSLAHYNNLLRKTHIAIPHYPKEGVTRTKGLKVPYNTHNKFVRRIFNNGTFDDGGRFYGGFWQNIPKEWRLRIRINGQPIVEHDYSGLHINLLYAKENKQHIGDPYSLNHSLYSDEELRPYLKQLLLIMLNCRNEKQVLNAVRNAIQWDTQLCLYNNYNHQEFIELLSNKHKPIEKYLYSGYGITLQNIDSSIAHQIIDTFTKRSITILCIHDSFICDAHYGEELTKAMERAYESIASTKAISLSYKGTDPYLLRNDKDTYIDMMLKNRDRDYEYLLKQHQEKVWEEYYM
jgi:hypothetical protein